MENKRFSILELMVVLAIMAVFAAIVIAALHQAQLDSNKNAATNANQNWESQKFEKSDSVNTTNSGRN